MLSIKISSYTRISCAHYKNSLNLYVINRTKNNVAKPTDNLEYGVDTSTLVKVIIAQNVIYVKHIGTPFIIA